MKIQSEKAKRRRMSRPITKRESASNFDVTENIYLKFIKEVGVPAGIAFYVLVRLEGAIQRNTEVVSQLVAAISKL